MRPTDLKYSESHEWVKIEGDIAVIGITDFAVQELSDLVYIELPEEGDNVEQDSNFGEIESVKTVSELISPLTGSVVEVNSAVADDLEILAGDPYEEGWLIKIKMSDPEELNRLMTSKEYDERIADENDTESPIIEEEEKD